ncbi:MAG: hypothetical protein ACRDWA_14410 [Acidimicrobiia bacterium]
MIALLLATLLLATEPGGPDISPIVDELELRRFYLEEGIDASVDELERLVDRFDDIYFVALESESDADALADDLLDRFGSGTVVVLTPSEIGAVSTVYDDDQIDAALDETVGSSGSTYLEDFSEFAGALTGVVDSSSEGGGFSLVPVLVVVGIVGLVGFFIWRGSAERKQAKEKLFAEAREEIRQQMDVIANEIVDLADDPRVASNETATNHYRQASETFRQAESRLAAASTLDQLEDLSDDLDRARWQLDASNALVEGRPLPPEPTEVAPPHCFFDPTHGTGRVEAEIQTPAGARKVMVCEADAEKLRRGQSPDARQIPYDSQPVPAPRAPRTHGGLGMDWLEVFSIIVGGMGSGLPYDWSGGPRTRGRGRGGIPFPSVSRGRGSAARGSRSQGRRTR